MKKYLKEIIIFIIEVLLFYLLPFTAGPGDEMGLVVLLLFTCNLLAFILGIISSNKIKWLYPIAVAVVFIPTVYIHYNETALVHSVWYLVDAYIGLIFGHLIYLLRSYYGRKKQSK